MKIIQYFVGDDQKYLHLAKLSEEINKKYAEIHNYKYEMSYLPLSVVSDYYGTAEWKDVIAYKIKFIYDKLCQNNEDLAYLDADAAVNNPNMQIEMFMDKRHELFLSRGNEKWYQISILKSLFYKLTQLLLNNQMYLKYYDNIVRDDKDLFCFGQMLSYENFMFNEGFMIIRNTPITKKFFAECLKNQFVLRNISRTNATPDGRSISFTAQYDEYQDLVAFMVQNAQGGFLNAYGTNYNQAITFILHNFGKGYTIDQKIDAIEKLKSNRNWKQLFK